MASSIKNIVERLTAYVQIKTEQVKLKIIERVSRMLAAVISFSFISVLVMFFIFFLSFSMGSLINRALESDFLGHLIIAGFYLLLIIILFLLVKTRKVQGWLENVLLNISENDDEQED